MSETSKDALPFIDERTARRVLDALGTLDTWAIAAVAPHGLTPQHMKNPHAAKKAMAQILQLVNAGARSPNTAVADAIAESGFSAPAHKTSHVGDDASSSLGDGVMKFLHETGG